MQKGRILRNRIKCLKCGDIIESFARHDFKWCSCENIAVDGGHDYLRRCGTLKDGDLRNYDDMSITVFENTPFEVIRENMLWGTYGKDGKQPFKRVALKDMSDEHIRNVLKDFGGNVLSPLYEESFKKELEYRKGAYPIGNGGTLTGR